MKIVFYEMKKLWDIKMLLAIAVLCALFYSIFMSSSIDLFPNGHSITEEVGYSIEMTQRYGPTLEADEYSKFTGETRGKLILEAERYIQNNPVFENAGIYSYADYEKVYEKQGDPAATEAEHDAIWALLGEKCDFVRFKLQALNLIENRYKDYPQYTLTNLISEAKNKKELARLTEIRDTEEYRNIMDGWVLENTVTYAVYLAILAVLVVLVFVSPLIVTDRAGNVQLLQYTAKRGRELLKQQLIAILLSAFLLTTAVLFAFGAIYSTNGTWPFWNSGLTSFLSRSDTFFLFDMTYGQYVIAYAVMLYILCLGAAAIAFLLSRLSQNLIALILKLIPAFAVLGAICFGVFFYAFNSVNVLYRGTHIAGIEPAACGLIFITVLAISLYTVRREKDMDVL